jgi:diguanylate cyclase (GGDEF)-like protein
VARPASARRNRTQSRRGAAPRSDLAATHWWLAAAVELLDDHVYFGVLEPDGSYTNLFAGPNLERMLGGALPPSPEDASLIWRSRIEPDDLPAYRACERELLIGHPAQVDYRVHGLDGETRWIRARVHPEQLADGTVRFAGILSDISEQREADDRLRAALAALASANAKLDAARSHALELARTDTLTGAANRRHVDEVMAGMLAGDGEPIGVFLLDIDDFKDVNDRYGHRVGDEVLVEVVARLQRAVRPRDVVARWGGEEFLLLCRAGQRESVRAVAERMRMVVCAQPFPTTIGELAITVSVGAVASRGLAQPADPLIDAADAALLAAKRAGKNRTVIARRPRPHAHAA